GIGSGLIPFGSVALWVTIVLVGGAGWLLALRARIVDRITVQHLAIAEAGFLLFFSLFIWFHGYGPDLTSQEKNSDMMMLSSAMRADSMPPTDAWLAGNDVNYYYLGFVLFGSIGRMIGAVPAETFSLALATVFGMTMVAIAGLAGNIVGRWTALTIARIGGVLAIGFVVVSGNAWAAFTWLSDPAMHWNRWFFGDIDEGELAIAWHSTRILNDNSAISEFPAFSFILADLHPHLMALPYAITALGVGWMLTSVFRDRNLSAIWPKLFAAGGIIGSLYALNAWDFPTYLIVGLLALLWGGAHRTIRERVLAAGIVIASSLVIWLPFYVKFEAPTRQGTTALAEALANVPAIGGLLASVSGYTDERTTFGQYLSIFGFIWVIAIALIAVEFYRRREQAYDAGVQKMIILGGAVFLIGGLITPAPVLIAAGLPVVAILLLFERDRSISLPNISLGLFGLGFALTLVPEFFFLIDIFNNRMNTVFKLYYQIWLLTGLASAFAVISLIQAFRSAATMRVIVGIGAAGILALGAVFPVVAGHQWLEWRNPEREWVGLDGLAYLEATDPGAYAAIDWLWHNAETTDVMLAAGGCDWVDALGRPSAGSGVPTIIGWDGHEIQWHLGDPEYPQELVDRNTAVQDLFETLNPTLLDEYNVSLLYIGDVEVNGTQSAQDTDSRCSPGPFDNAGNAEWPGPGWTEVFNQDDVRILRRDST
ncbi:MAG: DUF2298 domain-containing protein, partial [Thermomicrobiales bacterium]